MMAYTLSDPDVPVVHLAPGQFVVTADPCTVRTILGSCVGICLWDRKRRVGGMNHFLLPGDSSHDDSPRHGEGAMKLLYDGVLELGALTENLTAHVLGGARVLAGVASTTDLGERNIEFAMRWLERAEVTLSTLDVGGSTARRVEFSLVTGTVSIRRLGGQSP
jgi:chemotaxis protein CheD